MTEEPYQTSKELSTYNLTSFGGYGKDSVSCKNLSKQTSLTPPVGSMGEDRLNIREAD